MIGRILEKIERIHFLLFALLILALPLVLGRFDAGDYYISVLVLAGINSIVVVGLNLLMGYAGQISLGHAAFFGVGAYSSAIVTTNFGLSPLLGFALSIGLNAVIAYFLAEPILKLKGHYLAMATLGMGMIFSALFSNLPITGGSEGISVAKLHLLGYVMNSRDLKEINYYYFTWIVTLVLVYLALNLVDSRVGRALRAIHSSEVAAHSIGVNIAHYKTQVFVLSAIYAGIGGSIFAHYSTFLCPPDFGLNYSIRLVTMGVIGGMSSIWGGLLGASILSMLPQFLDIFAECDILIYGLVLILAIIFMPQGISKAIGGCWKKIRQGPVIR
ncbi:MAG: branched-chain amino acid ABC transporter permease [bacterium]